MSKDKQLNNEELEKVSGGVPYIGITEPNEGHFYHHVGDSISYHVYGTPDKSLPRVDFTVVALGKKLTGSQGLVVGYSLLYKLEAKNRSQSSYDGWYDLVPCGFDTCVQKAPDDGIVVF